MESQPIMPRAKPDLKSTDQEIKGFHKVTRRMVENHLTNSVDAGIITEEEKDLVNYLWAKDPEVVHIQAVWICT